VRRRRDERRRREEGEDGLSEGREKGRGESSIFLLLKKQPKLRSQSEINSIKC
jgi:hypothetical protein